jgi:hypothetical protein
MPAAKLNVLQEFGTPLLLDLLQKKCRGTGLSI